MNLEKRLTSAAQELNQSAQRTSPPLLRTASELIRPWLAFAAALAVVLAVFGIPYALTNAGQGNPPNSSPLAGAESTTTTECLAPETTTPPEEPGVGEEPSGTTADCIDPDTTIATIEPTTTPGQGCQAAEFYPPTTAGYSDDGSDPRDLTGPVAEKVTEIAEAAAGCNANSLAALASDDITTTFGPGSGPEDLASWQPDDERFAILAELLNMNREVTEMPDGSRLYVWPAAFAYDTWEEIPTAAMDELLRLYTPEELNQISLLGSYGGWRIGITETGEWIFFVAGD